MEDLRKIISFCIIPFDFVNKYFKVFVLILVAILLLSNGSEEDYKSPNLAKLYLSMPIYESESFAEEVKKITENEHIKGVLLIIDSPGGSVGASIEVADIVKNLSQKMPVVAYVQGSMASGSYYAGMYAKEIYANRGALLGSIGVIFSGFNVEELMDKLGIKEQGLKAGAYKEVGTSMRQWNDEEKRWLEHLLQEQYAMFYEDVIKARDSKLATKDYHVFAEGKIFSAHTAQKLGLIDKVGSMQDAIDALRTHSNVDEVIWLKKDKLDMYMDKFLDTISLKILSFLSPTFKAIL